VLVRHREGEPVDLLKPVCGAEQVVALQHLTRQVRFDAALAEYLLDIVEATRRSPQARLGASPRAALALYRAAQAAALLAGREYVVPDDVKQLASPTLAHRILLKTGPLQGSMDAAQRLLDEELARLPVPK
jgi:MoxR-like ATPase